MRELSGQCLCGGIVFRTTGVVRDVLNCHCHRCRRFTGHHMAAAGSATADLVVEDPAGLLTWYPVDGAAYAFCRRCGSSLFWRGTASPESTSICAGTLDPPTGLVTTEAWWTSEASDYHPRIAVPERATE